MSQDRGNNHREFAVSLKEADDFMKSRWPDMVLQRDRPDSPISGSRATRKEWAIRELHVDDSLQPAI
jgi:hypothetical protein